MARRHWNGAAQALAGIALCAYPVVVWLGLDGKSPRAVALVLLVAFVPAALLRMKRPSAQAMRGLAIVPLATIVSLAAASLLDSMGFLLAVPVAINAVLLIAFGSTLRAGSVPMIERFARLQDPDLNDEQVAWCALWTRIWCAFFVVNGSTALTLALAAPVSWWALYNGLLSYLLCGVMFATEWLLRRRRWPDAVGRAKDREA